MYKEPFTEYFSMISTMKVTLLFALFGLSFYQAIADITRSGQDSYSNYPNCATEAVKKSAETANAYGNFICSSDKAEKPGTSNFAAFQDASAKFADLLKSVDCYNTTVVNGITLSEMFGKIAQGVTGTEEMITKFKDAVGFGAASDEAFCILIGDILTSECTYNLLAHDTASLTEDLGAVLCELNSGAISDAATNFGDILMRTACVVDGKLNIGQTLQNLLEKIGLRLIGVIKKLLPAVEGAPYIDGSVCNMKQIFVL